MINYDRNVKQTRVKGVFSLPMFVHVTGQPGDGHGHFSTVEVSTVCLEDGHLESPIPGMIGPEHGYETMVFLGNGSVGVYRKHYNGRRAARRGHDVIVAKLLVGTLPLSIQLGWYSVWDDEAVDLSAAGQNKQTVRGGSGEPSDDCAGSENADERH